MNSIEQSLAEVLERDDEVAFATTDDELFKRAVSTASVQQGSKDLIALGMASIWVVFASIFMKILKPVFKNMANTNKSESK
ncbi:MAG: hypothetical protein WBC60_06400 [Cognaticolwellia sp.]